MQRGGDFSQTFTAAGALVAVADPLTTTQQPNGTYIRQVFPGNVIPQNRISTVASNVVKAFPLPTLPGQAFTNVNNYSTRAGSRVNEHQIISKIDHNLNTRWKIFGTYSRDWLDQGNDDPFGFEPKLTRAVKNIRNHATVSATAVFNPALIGNSEAASRASTSAVFPTHLGSILRRWLPESLCRRRTDPELPCLFDCRAGWHWRLGLRRTKLWGNEQLGSARFTDLGEGRAHLEVWR